ncbi:hypothetical protein GGP62_002186 [Salinibacter ruber]|uniref:hypothetical protein n=1 Tax=Salinibacter ruber TaxID=146919 RepID=UPI002169C015|nr:hypothetical protein [Salinibacter ruber]MCS3707199.1 hypothetical protein [Salinibacter ruber]
MRAITVRPDKALIEDEAREEVKRALASYPHPSHVLLYAAHDLLQNHPRVENGWNVLQKRSDLPAEKLANVLIDVDEHLNERIEDFLHG